MASNLRVMVSNYPSFFVACTSYLMSGDRNARPDLNSHCQGLTVLEQRKEAKGQKRKGAKKDKKMKRKTCLRDCFLEEKGLKRGDLMTRQRLHVRFKACMMCVAVCSGASLQNCEIPKKRSSENGVEMQKKCVAFCSYEPCSLLGAPGHTTRSNVR